MRLKPVNELTPEEIENLRQEAFSLGVKRLQEVWRLNECAECPRIKTATNGDLVIARLKGRTAQYCCELLGYRIQEGGINAKAISEKRRGPGGGGRQTGVPQKRKDKGGITFFEEDLSAL